jgi:hypothetical protein
MRQCCRQQGAGFELFVGDTLFKIVDKGIRAKAPGFLQFSRTEKKASKQNARYSPS